MARLIDPAGNKGVSKKVVDMVSSSAAGVYVIPVAGIEILSVSLSYLNTFYFAPFFPFIIFLLLKKCTQYYLCSV
jgi:hypothetical protein